MTEAEVAASTNENNKDTEKAQEEKAEEELGKKLEDSTVKENEKVADEINENEKKVSIKKKGEPCRGRIRRRKTERK